MDLQEKLAHGQRVLGVREASAARLEQHPEHRPVQRQGRFR
jgi:hypothetical protein